MAATHSCNASLTFLSASSSKRDITNSFQVRIHNNAIYTFFFIKLFDYNACNPSTSTNVIFSTTYANDEADICGSICVR